MSHDEQDLVQQFSVETAERLTAVEDQLLAWQQSTIAGRPLPDLESDARSILRTLHSIKGAASFLGQQSLATLSHHLENVICHVHSRRVPVSLRICDQVLQSIDLLQQLVEQVQHPEPMDLSEVLRSIDELLPVSDRPVPISQMIDSAQATWRAEAASSKSADSAVTQAASTCRLELEPSEIDAARRLGQPVYVIEWQPGLDQAYLNWTTFRDRLEETGRIIASSLEDAQAGSKLPASVFVAHATILSREQLSGYCGTPAARIQPIPEGFDIEQITGGQLPVSAPRYEAMPVSVAPLPFPTDSAPRSTTETDPSPDRERDLVATARPAPDPAETSDPCSGETQGPVESISAMTLQGGRPSELSTRVSTQFLDHLLVLSERLTKARELLVRGLRTRQPALIRLATRRLRRATAQMQQTVIQTRRRPISGLLGRLPRVVRDLSRRLGKPVQIVMTGRQIEVDQTVLELIADPLVHLIRNSVDHGIESQEERLSRCKPVVGTIRVDVAIVGDRLRIRVHDDGNGLREEELRLAVVRAGICTTAQARTIRPPELWRYIFEPRLSTSRTVSQISGRGLGLDVVKTNVEQLQGQVQVHSEAGLGMTVVIDLPLQPGVCLLPLPVPSGPHCSAAKWGESANEPTVSIPIETRPGKPC